MDQSANPSLPLPDDDPDSVTAENTMNTPPRLPSTASESETAQVPGGDGVDGGEGGSQLVGRLDALLDEMMATSARDLADGSLQQQLETVVTATRRLQARTCHLLAEATRRRAAALTDPSRPETARSTQRAFQRAQSELGEELRLSPGEIRNATRLGSRLEPPTTSDHDARDDGGGGGDGGDAKDGGNAKDGDGGEAGMEGVVDAFGAGELPIEHARLLTSTIDKLPAAWRPWAHIQLLDDARQQDPVEFGKSCRRLLAQLAPTVASRDENQRHDRRSVKTWTDAEGMYQLYGRLTGINAETVARGLQAFRRPDTSDEYRRPDQATADALAAMAKAALDAGSAPTHRGARPHLLITINQQQLDRYRVDNRNGRSDDGNGSDRSGGECNCGNGTRIPVGAIAELPTVGPLPAADILSLLHDAGLTRLVLDADATPVEVSTEVRTVPAGLAKALQLRDPVCIATGCDVPAVWCDTMHLAIPFHKGGKLSLTNAAHGCRFHHRAYDNGRLTLTWNGNRPVLTPPGEP